MKHSHQLLLKKKKINVLILCGGYGSRISNITKNTAKPLIKIFNKPFLYYLIKNLSRYNFENFYLLTHYKNNDFIEFKRSFEKELKSKIKIISEQVKLDTGGAVINAVKRIKNKNDYLLINGDTYLDANFNHIYKEFKSKNSLLMILIKKSKESEKLNSLSINKYNKIIYSKKKFMNSGFYFFKRKNIKKYLKFEKCSFENFILKNKIQSKQVRGVKIEQGFIDIGSYKSLKELKKFITKYYLKKKILFIDRDNTLNYDKGYTFRVKDLGLIKKNILFIKNNYENYIKVIITNQSGIGRGFFSERQFQKFMLKLNKKLENNSIYLSKVYYCPHHINANKKYYKKNCDYRKPNNMMILDCLNNLDIKIGKNVYMIGNDLKDKQLAKKSKISYLDQFNIN